VSTAHYRMLMTGMPSCWEEIGGVTLNRRVTHSRRTMVMSMCVESWVWALEQRKNQGHQGSCMQHRNNTTSSELSLLQTVATNAVACGGRAEQSIMGRPELVPRNGSREGGGPLAPQGWASVPMR
jgi:hypothetical protein